jgi:O-methyltransferase involved in polyketide biosynthesis
MVDHRERVVLHEAQETLLIPLYGKATESRRPNPIFVDAKAQEILEGVDYDFGRLAIPRKTSITLCIRARKLDDYARAFLAAHPAGLVLHLGCGLDSRCLRVPHAGAEWYDLDMPDVIELRRSFYDETPGYHMIASSVTDHEWMEAVTQRGRPTLVIAEGLLMYLLEAQVRALALALRAAFPRCELACDVYSEMTARRAHNMPSLKRTGATIHWGINDARAIEGWAPGVCLREEWYFTRAPEIARLGLGYRLAFALAGRFRTANQAHRIVYLEL